MRLIPIYVDGEFVSSDVIENKKEGGTLIVV